MFDLLKKMLGLGEKAQVNSPVSPLVGTTDRNDERYTRAALTCDPNPTSSQPPRKETELNVYSVKAKLEITHDYTTFVIEPPILRESTCKPDADRRTQAVTQSKIAGEYFCSEIATQLAEYARRRIDTGSALVVTYTGRSTNDSTQSFSSENTGCTIEVFIRTIEREKDTFPSHIWPNISLYVKDENEEHYLLANTGIVEKVDACPFDTDINKQKYELIIQNQLFCITTVNPKGNEGNQVMRKLVKHSLTEVVKKLEADGKGRYTTLPIDEFKAKE